MALIHKLWLKVFLYVRTKVSFLYSIQSSKESQVRRYYSYRIMTSFVLKKVLEVKRRWVKYSSFPTPSDEMTLHVICHISCEGRNKLVFGCLRNKLNKLHSLSYKLTIKRTNWLITQWGGCKSLEKRRYHWGRGIPIKLKGMLW